MIGSFMRHPATRFVIKAGVSSLAYEESKRLTADMRQRMSGFSSRIFAPTDEIKASDRRVPTYKKE